MAREKAQVAKFVADADDLESILDLETRHQLVEAVQARHTDAERDVVRHAIWIGGAFEYAEERGFIGHGKIKDFCKEVGYTSRRVQQFRAVYHERHSIASGLERLSAYADDWEFKVPASGLERVQTAIKVAKFFVGADDTRRTQTLAIYRANEELKPQPRAKPSGSANEPDSAKASGMDWFSEDDTSRGVDRIALLAAIRRIQVASRNDEHGYVMLYMEVADFDVLADFAELPENQRQPKQSEASSGRNDSKTESLIDVPYTVTDNDPPVPLDADPDAAVPDADKTMPPCPKCQTNVNVKRLGRPHPKQKQRYRCWNKTCGGSNKYGSTFRLKDPRKSKDPSKTTRPPQ